MRQASKEREVFKEGGRRGLEPFQETTENIRIWLLNKIYFV